MNRVGCPECHFDTVPRVNGAEYCENKTCPRFGERIDDYVVSAINVLRADRRALRHDRDRLIAGSVEDGLRIERALVHLTGVLDSESPMSLHARIVAARAELE